MSAHTEIHVIPQEARPYQGQRAGIVSRVLANVVDVVIVVLVVIGLYFGWAGVRLLVQGARFHFPTPGFALAFVTGAIVAVAYFTIAWSTSGRTYGDHVLGLRVVNARGHRLGLLGAFVRAVLCVVFPVLLFWAAFSKRNRSVQDVVLRTSVVYDWRPRPNGRARAARS